MPVRIMFDLCLTSKRLCPTFVRYMYDKRNMNQLDAYGELKKRLPHGAITEVAKEFDKSPSYIHWMLKKMADHPAVNRLLEIADAEDARKDELAKRMKGQPVSS